MKITPINNKQNFGLKLPFIRPNKKNEVQPNHEQGGAKDPQDLSSLLLAQSNGKTQKTHEDRKTIKYLTSIMSPTAKKIYDSAFEIAKATKSNEVESWHLYLASLYTMKNYMAGVEKGEIDPSQETLYSSAYTLPDMIYSGCNLWDDDELRKETAEIINKYIEAIKNEYVNREPKASSPLRVNTPGISANAIRDLNTTYETVSQINEEKSEILHDKYFLSLTLFSEDAKLKGLGAKMVSDLNNLGMTEKPSQKEKHHIEFYDTKADAIWKNIARGNNVLVLNSHENEHSFAYLKNSFTNLIHKPGTKYGSLDPEKVNIITLNKNATFEFIEDTVRNTRNKKDNAGTTTIIVGDFLSLLRRSGNTVTTDIEKMLYGSKSDNPNEPNIRFVFSITPESYNANTNSPTKILSNVLTEYAKQTLPLLNAADAKQYLANESGLNFVKAVVKKEVSKDAVHKAIEATSTKSGNYPEKAINLLDAVGKFFVDSEEITPSQIDIYLKETESLSDVTDTKEQLVTFDTEKTLNDIKGMPMVKSAAESIVKKIKDGIGTKGYVIYHADGGGIGGGRRHTAEAIAGEAQIPMIVINAQDFAIKDIDALSQQANLSEIKIKKIVQTAKAQAEANESKTAMIFIENFDNFASDPIYGISSIYEQKAFTQLLEEMEAIRKEGKVNLIIIGSTNMPEALDENIAKPNKFLNQIIIYQPQDKKQTREVIDYYIDKFDYKIATDTQKEKEEILNDFAALTQGYPVIYLMLSLETAQTISKERGKEAIDSSDLNEAFLQVTSGRMNPSRTSEHRKKIITSHEAGHALTARIMQEIMKKHGNPWEEPMDPKIISLDPRADYSGVVFYTDSDNDEWTFERKISDIISCYGGHSAELALYGMNGSWGISADMQSADETAKRMVTIMGLGQKTGTRHIANDTFLTSKQKDNVAQDVETLLHLGRTISNAIVYEYKDFIAKFTKKYSPIFGTGECTIPIEQFVKELEEWRAKQTDEKRAELDELEKIILEDLNTYKSSCYKV